MSRLHKGTKRNGQWTEIFTKKKSNIPGYLEGSEGHVHSQGWACTCGCNKRIPMRKHSEGPPREACEAGFHIATGASTNEYRNHYRETFGHD